jgi:hypothetical protein
MFLKTVPTQYVIKSPILPFLMVCTIFFSSLILCNTSPFLTRSVQLIFSILLRHNFSQFSKYFWSTFRSVSFSSIPSCAIMILQLINVSSAMWRSFAGCCLYHQALVDLYPDASNEYLLISCRHNELIAMCGPFLGRGGGVKVAGIWSWPFSCRTGLHKLSKIHTHLEFLGARLIARSKFQPEGPQILGVTVHNLVSLGPEICAPLL